MIINDLDSMSLLRKKNKTMDIEIKNLCSEYNSDTHETIYKWLSIEEMKALETYDYIFVKIAHIFNKQKLAKAIEQANEFEEQKIMEEF